MTIYFMKNMARPDIKNKRREQILDAFETCVARYGVEGATLNKIAETAGLARPLVRHNVGNRDDLLNALVERFLHKSRDDMAALTAELPCENRSETLVDTLFDPQYSDTHMVQVSGALIAASAENPSLAIEMQVWLDDFIAKLDEVLSRDFSNADPAKVAAVVAGITGIYFNVEALYPLGNVEALITSSKQAALILLASLENT